MINRLKVLGAMLALREFTVADLASFSGVKLGTVRSVVGRNKGYLEPRGRQKSRQRGGRFEILRVSEDQVSALRSTLKGRFAELRNIEEALPDGFPAADTIALGVLATEDTLVRRLPKEEDPGEKRQLLGSAQIALAGARADTESLLSAVKDPVEVKKIQVHLRATENLMKLSTAELDLPQDWLRRLFVPSGLMACVRPATALLKDAEELSRLGDVTDANSIYERVSPVLEEAMSRMVRIIESQKVSETGHGATGIVRTVPDEGVVDLVPESSWGTIQLTGFGVASVHGDVVELVPEPQAPLRFKTTGLRAHETTG